MAVITGEATYFMGTKVRTQKQAGRDGEFVHNPPLNYVARFKFTTDGQGATNVSFQTTKAGLASSPGGDYVDYAESMVYRMRFAITQEATTYIGYNGEEGNLCTGVLNGSFSGSIDVELLPNTEYYLWLFPGYSMWAVFTVGDCTITTSGQYGTPSTISAGDSEFGQAIQITLNRGLATMLHTVQVSCAGQTETLIENSSEYPTISWIPELETYAPLIPESSYAEATITAETFLNGNSLGTSEKTIKVYIPDGELLPVLSEGWASVSPYNTGQAEGFKCFITGYSQAEVSFDESLIDVSGTMGASVKSFSISYSGGAVSEAPYRTEVLHGAVTIDCTITDSRGRSVTEALTVNPLPYSKPALTQISIVRCDKDGNESEDGYYYSAKATAVYSLLNGENGYSMKTAYRNLQGSYGSSYDMISGTALVVSGTSPDASYEIKIELTDELGNSTMATRKLPTRQWALKFREDALGVAFGKAPEFEKAVELPSDWEIRRGLTEKVLWSGSIISLSVVLSATGWSDGSQTVAIENLGANDDIIAAADPEEANETAYTAAGIKCRAQAEGSLTFTCNKTPTVDITANLLIIKRT